MNTTLKLKSNNSFNPNPSHFNPKFFQNYTLTPKFHTSHKLQKHPQTYISTPNSTKLHFDRKLFQNHISTPNSPEITFWPQNPSKSHFDTKLPILHFNPKIPQNYILTPKPYKHSSQAIQSILLKPYKHTSINSKVKFIYLYLIVLFFSWIPCLYDYNMIFHMK